MNKENIKPRCVRTSSRKKMIKKENLLDEPNYQSETQSLSSEYFNDKNSLKTLSDFSLDSNEKLNLKREYAECDAATEDLNKLVKSEPKTYSETNDERETNCELHLKKIKWEPVQWKEQFERIKEMRKYQSAPVDTMGCDALSSIDATLLPNIKRYQVLVSLMLSSQTKDEVTAKAINQLQTLPLEIDVILSTNDETLEKMIYPASFYKRKVQYIKKTSQILKEKYNYDIPDSIDELCKLPGVGPKMAYITMSVAWNKTVGIGVDTHVHRISNRLGWTRKQTKLPEQTRKELEEWLPQSYWNEVNHLLVGFGQQTCRPVGPKCTECLCRDICPFGKTNLAENKSKKGKKLAISNQA